MPKWSFDHPVTVLVAFVASLVVGLVAWTRIPLQLMPAGFEPGWLWVWVPYADASPTEIDERIVRPIETQLSTVPGVTELESYAASGDAEFSIGFHDGADMDEAYNAVVDRLERAMPDLPTDVERYGIFRYNPNDEPVIWAGVSLPEAVEDPYYVMTKIVQPRLERIPGVAALDVWGVPQRGIYVDYDKERVYAAGIDLGDVQRRLSTDNFQISAGRLLDRGLVRHARGLSTIRSVEDLASFPVRGDTVLRDIADVELRAALSRSINRVDGEDAAAFAVRKESSANAVEVSAAVTEALAELEADPRLAGTSFFVFFSQGALIEDSVGTLVESAVVGGLLAVAVLWVFLREWRITALIAAAIPFSMWMTVGIQYFRGGTLNLLSLMGLMLAVGMVVDNAIVVVEAIYARRMRGDSVRDAAIGGTAEVNLAVVLSTMTSMVVFLPVILMSESAEFSFFMGELGLPVVFALGASLVVALLFAPLATRAVRTAAIRPDPAWLAWVQRMYARALALVSRRRADSLAFLCALGVLTAVVALPGVQCVDSAEGNLNDFVVRFTVPPQADPYERDTIVRRFEQTVEEHRDAWGVRVYRARLSDGERQGQMFVYLVDDGPMERTEVMEAAREAFPKDLAGVDTTIGWEGGFDQQGDHQLGLSVFGEDMGTLRDIAREIQRRVRGVEGVIGAEVDLESEGADEVRLVVDREASRRYGVSARQIGNLVAYAMRGTSLPEVRDGEHEVEVVARFALEDRSDLDELLDLDVWSPLLGSLVSVRSLTSIEIGKGPGRIERRDRRTSTGVTIDLAEDLDPMTALPRVEAALADLVLPTGYGWTPGDAREQREEEDAAIVLAMILSVTFVFLLIGVLFESWLLPLAVVTTIPMAGMGAVWGLYLSGTPLDMMAFVGMIILVGVVVNNGIVLVDLVHQLRAEGVPRDEALLQAGQRRLRPILMTALTTIFGLVPMAAGASTFVGIPYAPLGRTVISGMIAGTLLTLLFVPFLYALLDDLRTETSRWVAWVRR